MSDESDTPKTDDAIIYLEINGHPLFRSVTYVTPDFARQLERDANNLREDLKVAIGFLEDALPTLEFVDDFIPSCGGKKTALGISLILPGLKCDAGIP